MTLQEQVTALLARLCANPAWAGLLGQHQVASITPLDAEVAVDRSVAGFDDFASERARLIEPGDPARSLLYHCLASPAVQPGTGPEVPYATQDQLDLVENYIYSLVTLTEAQQEQLVPAVFCYEYREAAATPHQFHADLVFSRTGIARVGNAPALYDGRRRAYEHEALAAHEVRVMPARYAAFLCERVRGSAMDERCLGAAQHGDEGRYFLVPVVKLFPGLRIGAFHYASVRLAAFHLTDRLARLFSEGELDAPTDAHLNRPPFLRSTDNGGLQVDSHLVGTGSLIVAAAPQALVRTVTLSAGNSAGQAQLATTRVPPEAVGVPQYNKNRRYSTLRVGQKYLSVGVDFIGAAIVGHDRPLFLSPRNCSEFINMRHRVRSPKSTSVDDLNLTLQDAAEFNETLAAGQYQTALYMDDICDGYVSATYTADNGALYTVAPAFSVITAPDFFPCIGNLDLREFASHFKQGGPSPLCEGRLQANARMRFPHTHALVFSADDTIAAAVSAPPRAHGVARKHRERVLISPTALTDGASNVFAPGWDVSYGRDGLFSSPYYNTAGLGSPFLEDAKLCAAANGMWAAASPDASRTFNRAGTPTAVPLTDQELGIHPSSAGAGQPGASHGWDGGYGPFLEMVDGAVTVNYADIMRTDYVSNALRNLLRFDLLRKVSRHQMVERMTALGAAITLLDGAAGKVATTGRWLVVCRMIEQWSAFSFDYLVPAPVRATLEAAIPVLRQRAGGGILLGFVRVLDDAQPAAQIDRLRATVSEMDFVIWDAVKGARVL